MIISAISGTIAISTHAPRTGSDLLLVILVLADCDFNPRSPHGERQNQSSYATIPPISTHAPRTGSDGMPLVQAYRDAPISTHAPRTGSDRKSSRLTTPRSDFNPRSPHGERLTLMLPRQNTGRFQPTLPARGATGDGGVQRHNEHISTHAPRTGSDQAGGLARAVAGEISTHAPRTGSDMSTAGQLGIATEFQPTLPARGATRFLVPADGGLLFQPTLPARGATPDARTLGRRERPFQPTLPARGATPPGKDPRGHLGFQPTLPARGATETAR